MKIMSREADNGLEALLIAQGMENAGASVFSITHNGMHQPFDAKIPSSRFVVWAKIESDDMIDAVDKAIVKELDSLS